MTTRRPYLGSLTASAPCHPGRDLEVRVRPSPRLAAASDPTETLPWSAYSLPDDWCCAHCYQNPSGLLRKAVLPHHDERAPRPQQSRPGRMMRFLAHIAIDFWPKSLSTAARISWPILAR